MEEEEQRTTLSQQQSERSALYPMSMREEYRKILAILQELEKAADEAPIQKRLKKVAEGEQVERVLAAYRAFMVGVHPKRRTTSLVNFSRRDRM